VLVPAALSTALLGRAVRPLAPGVRLGVPAGELLSGELIDPIEEEPVEELPGVVMLLSGELDVLGIALLGEDVLGDRVLSEVPPDEEDARL
jgi:hypothetical protein